ncbi:hypothetical protein FJT64_007164 [Amphibalanus amphitrite]|uniref:Uncharacterized protein n=1 Tax=Amphibalanus amphitrite TaxID=1232801 RepID=A0A6A4VNR9_AMPAM|nr:hypothetical protein FJT64_007164 [Amphibalanus amphitrite]
MQQQDVTEESAEDVAEEAGPVVVAAEDVSSVEEADEFDELTEAPTVYATEFNQESSSEDDFAVEETTESSGDSDSESLTEAPGSNRGGRVFIVGPSITTQRPVIVGSDEQEAPPAGGITSPKPSVSPVEALFTMWADDSARPTSPLPRGETEVDVEAEESPLGEAEEHVHHDHDDHADHADHADHSHDGAQSSSLLNKPPAVLASSGDPSAAGQDPKESLLDQEEVLAYSTVTPRYRDPDSLFKRKTFISNSAPAASPGLLCWTLAAGAALLLRWL